MKTLHVLILAGAILGAAWILKPVPVEQVSQVELQRQEALERKADELRHEEKARKCAVSIGKTFETLDLNDPQQEGPYRKCLSPEDSRGPIRRMWDKMCGIR